MDGRSAALVGSQLLIVLHWHDARFGTAANLLLAGVVVVAAAIARFHAAGDAAERALLARSIGRTPVIVRDSELAGLPAPVQRWLIAAGVVGQPRARTVAVRQRGHLRTKPGGAALPTTATQVFSVDPPGFVWQADVTMHGLLPVVARDTFIDGRGRMLIRAAGLVTVADGTGPGFDRGAALRYLGELVWFPSAALAPSIRWAPIDNTRARATLVVGDVEVSAEFSFDERGRFTSLTTRRSYDGGGDERWTIPVTGWGTVRGIELPVRGGVVWQLPAGDFDYFQWEVLDVEVDPPRR